MIIVLPVNNNYPGCNTLYVMRHIALINHSPSSVVGDHGMYVLVHCCSSSSGLLCDLLWSDPDKETMGWGENDRGVSFTFGPEIVSKFLAKHDLDLICRAHQVNSQYQSLYMYYYCVL